MKKILRERDQINNRAKFQKAQTDMFVSLLSNNGYEKILDVGCGKGYFSYVTVKNVPVSNCYGVDIYNDFRQEEIKPFVKKISYKQLKSKQFPFPSNLIDLVFSMDVIEHVEDDYMFLSEQIRVCKSGGQIIIGTPNYWRLANILLKLFGKLHFPRKIGEDTYGASIHIREYSKTDLHRLVLFFEKQIDPRSMTIIPCWYGILPLNIGVNSLPSIAHNYCQFWFVTFIKI